MKKEWLEFIDNLDDCDVPSFLELLMDNKEFVLINCFTLNDLCLNIIEKLDEEYRSEAFAEFTFDTLVNYSTLPEYEIRNWINYFGVIKLSNNDISDFGKAIGFDYERYITDIKRNYGLKSLLDEN